MARRAAAIAVAIALVLSARAADARDPVWANRRPVILTLIINEVAHGDALVLLVPGDALVAAADLQRAGVTTAGGVSETFRERAFVSVRSLGIRFAASELGM